MARMSQFQYYERLMRKKISQVRSNILSTKTVVNFSNIYETPHFNNRIILFAPFMPFIGEGFTHSQTIEDTQDNYFYTHYISTYMCTLSKIFGGFCAIGICLGNSNSYISLSGIQQSIEKRYKTMPLCTLLLGMKLEIMLPEITIFNKKEDDFNAGKLKISMENMILPCFSIQFFAPMARNCRRIYGLDFTPDDIDKNLQTYKFNYFKFITTINLQYGFISLKIGNSYSYETITDALTLKHIAKIFNPTTRKPETIWFDKKEDAYNAIQNQRDKIALFYDKGSLSPNIYQLLYDKMKFLICIGFNFTSKEILQLVDKIRKKK